MPSVDKLRRQSLEVLSYLWIAVVGTIVNWSVAVLCRLQFGMGYTSSSAIGYGTGVMLGFVLSKAFSFKDRTSTSTKTESIKFLLVTATAFAVTLTTGWLILFGLTEVFQLAPNVHTMAVDMSSQTGQKWIDRALIANIGGTCCGFFVNFFGHKFLTFRKTDLLSRLRGKIAL